MEKLRFEQNLEMDKVLVGRHFEDVDDLTGGMDTDLKEVDEKSLEIISANAQMVIDDTHAKGMDKVLIISSPRKRAYSTASLLKETVEEKDEDLKVAVRKDDRFTELSHGEIVLPPDYVPGRRIGFLKSAWKVFWAETFNENGDYNNPNYRFGDPVALETGGYKHPELRESFTSYGESYRELSQRYYDAILDYLEHRSGVKSRGINVVLLAHSATLAILGELSCVAREMSQGYIMVKKGDLMKTCWKNYLDRMKRDDYVEADFGGMKAFSLEDIDDELILFMREELSFVSDPKNYEKS